jgi:hypothetical protein
MCDKLGAAGLGLVHQGYKCLLGFAGISAC